MVSISEQKSHAIFHGCNDYHKWNKINERDSGLEVYKLKIKKAHELERKYKLKRDCLIRILRLDEYRGSKTNKGTMAAGGRKQSYSNQDGFDNKPGK